MIQRRIVILFILVFNFFTVFSVQANPGLEPFIERSVRNILKLSGCADWLIEETSQKISQRVAFNMMEMSQGLSTQGLLTQAQMAQEFNRILVPKNLASLIQGIDDIPQKEMVIRSLEASESSLAVARTIISRQFLAEISGEATSQELFRPVWEKAKAWVSRGTKVDQEEVLDIVLKKSQDPKAWTEELAAKAGQGLRLLPEELVAYHSFFSPVEDLVLAQAIDQLYFRQALAIEFWVRRPKEVQYFFDHIRGVILPAQQKDLFPVLNANFSTAVLSAIRPDRRSAGFWHGLPESYANDKVAYDIKSQMVRLLSIKSLETTGALGELSYREFLVREIQKLEAAGRIHRLMDGEVGKFKELQSQLALVNGYQKAFQETAFDVFSQNPFSEALLVDILDSTALKEFKQFHKFQYWKKNAGLILVTTFFCILDRYLEERPEELIQPEEMYLPDSAVVKDIDLKINLVKVSLSLASTETDPVRLEKLQEYLWLLQEERKKYVK